MTSPELTENDSLGFYRRATEAGEQWWRVTIGDRPHTYRIEQGIGDTLGDIDLVVDAENLRAKLKKWHREGFVSDAQAPLHEQSADARIAFMSELARVVPQYRPAKSDRNESGDGSDASPLVNVRIGTIEFPCGAGHALVRLQEF